jgi:putative phosphoribosyl transferase
MFRDRAHAAHLLGEKLKEYKNTNAVVVAIPCGGVPIGHQLANELHLPLDVIPSGRIKNPASCCETIGSVSLNGIDMIESTCDIPQDYIYHQVLMTQYNLRKQYKFYQSNNEPMCLRDRVVLLVDDKLKYENQIVACLRSIRDRQPKKIIVVTPVVSADSLQRLQRENCDVVSLIAPLRTNAVEAFYESLPPVTPEEVKQLLMESNKGIVSKIHLSHSYE